MYTSLEAVEDGSNDVHADATARNLRHFGSRAEARFENKIESFLIGQALGLFGLQDTLFNSTGAQLGRVHATAIVANFDNDLRALMIGVEIDGAARGLSGSQALVGGLNAVVHRIAHQVHKGLGKRVKNALIEIGVLAGEVQGHILATLLGNIADDTRKTAEELLDGHHADFQNAFVQLIEDASLKRHRVGKLGAQGISGVLLVKLGQRAIEHGLANDQFADKIHDRIDARGIDPKRTFGNGGCSRTGSTGTDCS